MFLYWKAFRNLPKKHVSTAEVVERLRQASLEPRPAHPFFDKPTLPLPSDLSAEQSTTSDDKVIEIVDEESTIVISPDTPKPLLSLLPEAGSQEDPIVLDSSPLKPLPVRKPGASKTLAPLFAPRRPKSSAASTSSTAAANNLDAPYPDLDSQHVRGPQQHFPSSRLPFARREKPTKSFEEAAREPFTLKDLNREIIYDTTPNVPSSTADKISDEATSMYHSRSHPAISRFNTELTASASRNRMWVDKWHPTRADEVLGNEDNAMYLRDWIRALELHLGSTEPDANSGLKKGKNQGKTNANGRGIKRRRVVRAVEKRRGRKKRKLEPDDEGFDWIVYSDIPEESDPINYDDLDLYSEPARSSPPPDHEASSAYAPSSPPCPSASQPELVSQYTFDKLSNTILLVGPPGVGKTAAVYACAEELGWDVFEVYPGIGRRNGPGIDNLIGDAGKNHHVRKTRAANPGVSGAFTKLFKGKGITDSNVHEDAHAPSGDFGFLSPTSTEASEIAPTVRQSLILLEEVDIQFKEDTSFWPSVTNFIKDCRRPVICTCNGVFPAIFTGQKSNQIQFYTDISLVPTQDLPLQAILTFQPCEEEVATSYLQGLCAAEGSKLQREVLNRMYGDSAPKLDVIDTPDMPAPPESCAFPAPDLRRTINRLQFLCSSTDSDSDAPVNLRWDHAPGSRLEDLCDWGWPVKESTANVRPYSGSSVGMSEKVMGQTPPARWLAARHADLVSFVDSYLTRSPWDTEAVRMGHNGGSCVADFEVLFVQGLSWSAVEASNDDEVGHSILLCPRTTQGQFGPRCCDEEIASAVVWHSREALEPTCVISPLRTRELFRARVEHQTQMVLALGGMVPLSVATMRRAEVVLEYGTRIRDIVAAEDLWESLAQQKERAGRTTRNSGGGFDLYQFIDYTTRKNAAWPNLFPLNMQNGAAKNKDAQARPSPPPLAPLHYLQNQRRGSITDPSLHAASIVKLNTGYRDNPGHESPRSTSPFVFGDATPSEGLQIRNLLRSPSLERVSESSGGADKEMDVDATRRFDYNMRRHSVQGTKRKMDGADAALAGPGVPSVAEEGPAPKRRGSAIDTQRMTQLSLNDRRSSVDARASGPPWWINNDRRDSTSSIFSNVSSLGYSSAFTPGDSPHSRVPSGIANFSWPATPEDPTEAPVDVAPDQAPPLSDRRMSLTDVPPNRLLRSRSRPPVQEESPTNKDTGNTPYSRSPELRVSHKLAERKRRKEMKDLFDELRDQLPADRGMKASKWEILSKAIDFVGQLKQSHQDMAREMEMLRHELDATRQAMSFGPAAAPHLVYGQPPVPGQFPLPPPGTLHPHTPQHPPAPPPPPLSRPPSSQNVQRPPPQNGNNARTEPPPPT
ncbi:hypothetical protein H0H81_005032 [Sphagnurus paluster]|uniref:BHLH domain-containing protein n=1 Tax=Sphagnurus paluster TaxID=117069 RepID=A0A9P7KHB0_9AGAR|nr:hypothetical protein H0H81_005032 [Sphagnurus paluster]